MAGKDLFEAMFSEARSQGRAHTDVYSVLSDVQGFVDSKSLCFVQPLLSVGEEGRHPRQPARSIERNCFN